MVDVHYLMTVDGEVMKWLRVIFYYWRYVRLCGSDTHYEVTSNELDSFLVVTSRDKLVPKSKHIYIYML